ncbi:hypothetical protein EX30DRAFT_352665 [Ascodesmis nigricans]|uniref:Uncharacterized protein n=1 Tax=Ascodesmis nigricans TaxID=341454 RepID=A0A4S2MPV6_9PEZI|nr:hypothetical protein EX30DRAFT_352665 [Ascodesmis nigricans]
MSNNQITGLATGLRLIIPANQVQALEETMKAMAEMNRPVMPQLSTTGASYFNSNNVMKFLKSFERMVKTYGTKQPVENFSEEVPDYYIDNIPEDVQLLNGYIENNWKVFRKFMETSSRLLPRSINREY